MRKLEIIYEMLRKPLAEVGGGGLKGVDRPGTNPTSRGMVVMTFVLSYILLALVLQFSPDQYIF